MADIESDGNARLRGKMETFLCHRTDEASRVNRRFGGAWSENNVRVAPGGGTDIEKIISCQIFTDDITGQAAALGVGRVAGSLRPYAVRVLFEGEDIIEVEEILSTSCKGFFADVDKLLLPDILYEGAVPIGRRNDREQLLRRADSYWQALEESDGTIARFAYRSDRYDNGKKITNNLEILLSADAAVHTPASCVTATRPARPTSRNRRFPIIDTTLGVVVSFVLVDFHPAPHADRPDCGTFYMAGLFKIADDEIRSLDEIREILPLGSPEIWS